MMCGIVRCKCYWRHDHFSFNLLIVHVKQCIDSVRSDLWKAATQSQWQGLQMFDPVEELSAVSGWIQYPGNPNEWCNRLHSLVSSLFTIACNALSLGYAGSNRLIISC